MTSLNIFDVEVDIAGLTTATTLYSDGDTLGTAPLAFDLGAASGIIINAAIMNATINIGAVDLFLYDRSVSAAANNSPHSISDADRKFFIDVISFPSPIDDALGQVSSVNSLGIAWTANAGNTIYGIPVTRKLHTVHFGAATDLRFALYGSKDA